MSDETYKLTEKKKDQIQDAYVKYGFPSTTRLTQLMLKDGVKITKEEIKSLLDEQETQQFFNRHKFGERRIMELSRLCFRLNVCRSIYLVCLIS